MGTFSVRMRVANPGDPGRMEELEGIVDTGALHTQIPRAVAGRLGLRVSGRRTFRLADGTSAERELADVRIVYDGLEANTVAVIGEEGAPILWGSTTLETLGVKPDPVRQVLEPTVLYLL